MVAFEVGRGAVREATSPEGLGRTAAGSPVPVVLWVPDDDVRLLLRGILTLQRHPVVLELASAETLRRWEAPEVALLLIDAVSGADRWRQELAEALRAQPELRPIVLLPREQEALRREAEALGARATLVRPFAVRDLVQAIREALRGSSVLPGD
jgi:DNA-binding NarL/FixJ family response regulator